MYVYKITNKTTNKIYVGCTTQTPEIRLKGHIREAVIESSGKRPQTDFHRAMLEYGFDDFYIEPIEWVDTESKMYEREAYWIDTLNSIDPNIGYNRMTGGRSGKKNSDTKSKLSNKKKENWQDEELAEKMRNGLKLATEVWVKQCEDNRIEWKCPVCGRKLFLAKHMARDKKYCSLQCAASVSSSIGLKKALQSITDNAIARRNTFKSKVDEWVSNNIDLIMQCPKNKISTTLSGLIPIAKEYLQASDWRVVCYALCGSYSKKEALEYLRSVCENICRSGLN